MFSHGYRSQTVSVLGVAVGGGGSDVAVGGGLGVAVGRGVAVGGLGAGATRLGLGVAVGRSITLMRILSSSWLSDVATSFA